MNKSNKKALIYICVILLVCIVNTNIYSQDLHILYGKFMLLTTEVSYSEDNFKRDTVLIYIGDTLKCDSLNTETTLFKYVVNKDKIYTDERSLMNYSNSTQGKVISKNEIINKYIIDNCIDTVKIITFKSREYQTSCVIFNAMIVVAKHIVNSKYNGCLKIILNNNHIIFDKKEQENIIYIPFGVVQLF